MLDYYLTKIEADRILKSLYLIQRSDKWKDVTPWAKGHSFYVGEGESPTRAGAFPRKHSDEADYYLFIYPHPKKKTWHDRRIIKFLKENPPANSP